MKPPSPCVGVCSFRRPGPAGRHCIACSMTKAQRRLSKLAKKRDARVGFLALVVAQQAAMGRYAHWREAYAKRCRKRGVPVPEVVEGGAEGTPRT
ncbi:DUF1289 domain-containing protein [Jannaschia sp. W003]|uniref:DUF1289 domain-containing protein n=1 Tax=Jannaschia sp. W003 TaxID=2867012 RepID=UPI0021A927BD|nr:DUF1289 domain-containing protein [Jannaschia sp. W003]UWQ22642.1 DUF1289 domain-containing protein [Jannaschia sp. W003]